MPTKLHRYYRGERLSSWVWATPTFIKPDDTRYWVLARREVDDATITYFLCRHRPAHDGQDDCSIPAGSVKIAYSAIHDADNLKFAATDGNSHQLHWPVDFLRKAAQRYSMHYSGKDYDLTGELPGEESPKEKEWRHKFKKASSESHAFKQRIKELERWPHQRLYAWHRRKTAKFSWLQQAKQFVRRRWHRWVLNPLRKHFA